MFFRGAYTLLTNDRGGEVFTDTGGANRLNDDKGGTRSNRRAGRIVVEQRSDRCCASGPC